MNFSGYACDKPTSRVLNPPGGRSNNIFGAYEEPVASNKNTKHQTNVLNDNSNQQSVENSQMPVKADRSKSNIFHEQPAQQVNRNQRRGFNPITGRPYDEEEEKKQPAQQQQQHQPEPVQQQQQQQNQQPDGQQQSGPASNYHSSTRIFHPPGGKSTKLW